MVSMNQASRGRTVYSGGSFAPTRGPVSGKGAMGYVNRQVRQGNRGIFGGSSKFGRDGQSDTRSGVAQRAMQNRGGWGGKWAGPGEGKPGFQGNGPKGPGSGTGTTPPTIQGNGAPVGSPAQPAAPSPATPTVTVNNQGLLELPYSAEWSQDVLSGLEESNEELLGINQESQASAAKYALEKKMAGEGYVDQQRGTLNKDSGRGMAFSSGHAYNVGSDANNYNNLVNTLDTGFASENAEFDTRRTAATNAFKNMLRQSSLEYADTLDDEAGNLGYGQPDTRHPGRIGGGPVVPKGTPYKGKPSKNQGQRPPQTWGSSWTKPKPPKKPGGKKK